MITCTMLCNNYFHIIIRSKKFILYEVVKIWSDIGLNIYILYIIVMYLSLYQVHVSFKSSK